MTEPVKRYDPNYSAISPADDLAVEADDGMFVMHDDYARLEQECERFKADRSACWAEFKVMTRSCLDAEKERDAALAECERLRVLLKEVRPTMPRDVLALWCGDRDEALSAKP